MRYGYSLILREFVEADEVEFGDTEQFQITCPACRMAVFKKTRARSDGETTHFLSHYKAGTVDEKDCELRVDAMAREQIQAFNAVGRDQTLKGFLSVLPTALLEASAPVIPVAVHRTRINTVMARAMFRETVDYIRGGIANLLEAPSPRKAIEMMLATFPRFEDRSPFWRRRQSAYVEDVMRHLLTPQARRNMEFLAAAALVNLGSHAKTYQKKFAAASSMDRSGSSAVFSIAEAMMKGKSANAISKIVQMSVKATAHDRRQAAMHLQSIRTAFAFEALGPVVGLLGAVPWPDMARGKSVAEAMKEEDSLTALWGSISALFEQPMPLDKH